MSAAAASEETPLTHGDSPAAGDDNTQNDCLKTPAGKGCAIALLIVFSPLILALALALLPLALLLAIVLGFLTCIGRCVSGNNGETLNGPAPAKWQSLEVLDASGSKMPLEHLWRGPENAITVIAILRHIG